MKLIYRLVYIISLATMGLQDAAAVDIKVFKKNKVCQAQVGDQIYQCSYGKNGITATKKEGDNSTPAGNFPLRKIFVRPDHVEKDKLKDIKLPIQDLSQDDGWCDEPTHPLYNQWVDLKHFDEKVSHENLWRKDNLYNIITVVGYNDDPVVPGKGSAIFIHVAQPNYQGTAGCVGFSQEDLLKILPQLDTNSRLIVSL